MTNTVVLIYIVLVDNLFERPSIADADCYYETIDVTDDLLFLSMSQSLNDSIALLGNSDEFGNVEPGQSA